MPLLLLLGGVSAFDVSFVVVASLLRYIWCVYLTASVCAQVVSDAAVARARLAQARDAAAAAERSAETARQELAEVQSSFSSFFRFVVFSVVSVAPLVDVSAA
jgi:hypothetical protein